MILADIVTCSVCGLLSLLTLVTLKLALRRKQGERTLFTSRLQSEVTCWQNTKFLLLRFTIIELFAVRAAHLKLNWLLSVTVCSLLAFLPQPSYYWGWAVATLAGMLVFLFAELKIFKDESQSAVDLEDHRMLRWRRPLLYGVYALLTVSGFCYIGWDFAYVTVPAKLFGTNLGVMLLADQIVGRMIMSLIIGISTKEWAPMMQLRAQYFQFERASEQVNADKKQPSQPASPSKRNRKTFPSPPRIPKAHLRPLSSVQNTINQSKIQSRQGELDSVVNFLQQSQKKRIAKSRLPPMHSIYGTPTHKLKSGFLDYEIEINDSADHKYETPIRLIKIKENNNLLMSDLEKAIDDRVEGAENDMVELPSKELNTKSKVKQIKEFREHDMSSELPNKQLNTKSKVKDHEISSVIEKDGGDTKELDVYHHQSNQRSRILTETNKNIESQIVKTSKHQQQNNESDVDELNTVLLCSKNSVKSKPSQKPSELKGVQSPRDFIPKCHQDENTIFVEGSQDHRKRYWLGSSNNRSIGEIEQEQEQEQPKNGRFRIIQKPSEYQQDDLPENNRSKTMDPSANLRLEVRQTRHYDDFTGPRNSVLEIREDDIEQLEEVDLNSPMRKKELSPGKAKDTINFPPGRPKKKRTKKRDIRELVKFNSGSPYLEYLPNMLNKEIEQNKRRASERLVGRQLFKDVQEQTKRGKSTKRLTVPEVKYEHQPNTLLNNQNKNPDMVDDF